MPRDIPLLRTPTAAVTHPWAGGTGDYSSDCVGLLVTVAERPKLCSLRGHSACVIPWAGSHSPRIEFTCLSQGQHLSSSCLCPYFSSALLLQLFSMHLFSMICFLLLNYYNQHYYIWSAPLLGWQPGKKGWELNRATARARCDSGRS